VSPFGALPGYALQVPVPRPTARVPRKILPLLVCALASSACVAPDPSAVAVSTMPGWGRVHSPGVERVTVRAVPASATPRVPVTRTGKPGWGRRRAAAR
jgi:hypothetical protein